MKIDTTFARVAHTHRCFNEIKSKYYYTLVNKSAVVLGSKKINNIILKIEDSFKKCA